MENIPDQTGRPQHARRLFIIILTIAGFGLLGGVINFSTAIKQPLSFTSSNPFIKNQLTNGLVTTSVQDQQRIDALKTKDSDGDGLTDYDELYAYHTSPYLKDSDSDGISDYDEVKNGTDPNCPTGKACTPIAINANDNSNASTTSNAPSNTNQTNTAAASSAPQALLDTNALRQALLDAGAPQDQLNQLSDNDLITLYTQVLNTNSSSATNSPTTNANNNSNSNTTTVSSVTYQELQNMTAAEIRQLLIQGGADATSLNQLDDASLKSVFLQSISNLKVSN